MSSLYSPCAACKCLRRKCTEDCVFAPYFPADQLEKFVNVHKVYGASNIAKLLSEINVAQRADAVNSLAYEAEFRLRDPVHGCGGQIILLNRTLKQMQYDLYSAKHELASYIGPSAMLPLLQQPGFDQQHPNNPSGSSMMPDMMGLPTGVDAARGTPLIIHEPQQQQQQQLQMHEAQQQQLAAAVIARHQQIYRSLEEQLQEPPPPPPQAQDFTRVDSGFDSASPATATPANISPSSTLGTYETAPHQKINLGTYETLPHQKINLGTYETVPHQKILLQQQQTLERSHSQHHYRYKYQIPPQLTLQQQQKLRHLQQLQQQQQQKLRHLQRLQQTQQLQQLYQQQQLEQLYRQQQQEEEDYQEQLQQEQEEQPLQQALPHQTQATQPTQQQAEIANSEEGSNFDPSC